MSDVAASLFLGPVFFRPKSAWNKTSEVGSPVSARRNAHTVRNVVTPHRSHLRLAGISEHRGRPRQADWLVCHLLVRGQVGQDQVGRP